MLRLALIGLFVALLPGLTLAFDTTDHGSTTRSGINSSSPRMLVAGARAQEGPDSEQELADRYAPIVYLRQVNSNICDGDNEGFDPVAVDFVLGNEDIPLMTSENGEPSGQWSVVAEPPVAADLYGLQPPHFLNYPGSPLSPGCTYRQYFAENRDEARNVAYAHIYLEPGTDTLVLQYWMYYYLNDWNNTHEGDWEMIMLFFDATSVEEALAMEPEQVVFAQHGGGERADWGDEKLTLEEGRPVIYVARGAHASEYEPAIYLGLAENGTGFGCENSNGPHRRVPLEALVVPHEPSGPDDPYAWLGYTGRWGELKRSEWNGPTGPNTKTSWNEPVTWAEDVRDSSLIVPEYEGFGQGPIDLFCGAVATGSSLLVAFNSTPMLVLGLLGIVVATTSWLASYALGTVRQALGFYRANLRTFALVGAMLLPVGFVVALIQTLLFAIPPVEPLLTMMDRFPGVRIFLLLLLGSFQVAIAVIFVAPAVIFAVSRIRQGEQPGVLESYRRGVEMVWQIFYTRLRVVVSALLQAITIVGLPRAVRRLIGVLFIGQSIVISDAEVDEAVVESYEVAGLGPGRSAATGAVLYLIVLLTGPLVAIFLLLAIPSRPLGLVNFVSSLLFALLYPIGAIGMTLLYFDLKAEDDGWFEGSSEPETSL